MLKPVLVSLVFLGMATPVAVAQDARMNSIVVTASKVDTDDIRSLPNVFRRIPADFVLVGVTFQSGTRDAAERRAELKTVFDNALVAARANSEISFTAGEPGESMAPIETVLFEDIYRTGYGSTNGSFSLVMSVDTRKGDKFDQVVERGAAFIKAVPLSGRAEGYLDDDQFLGARDTDKHRADLLSDIKAEVVAMKTMFAPSKVQLSGLESRVITQPTGPLELDIFIPYNLTVTSE